MTRLIDLCKVLVFMSFALMIMHNEYSKLKKRFVGSDNSAILILTYFLTSSTFIRYSSSQARRFRVLLTGSLFYFLFVTIFIYYR